MDNGKGINVKCMKQVDDTKYHFNWIENDKIYYKEQQLLHHLEPLYSTNSRMTLGFPDSDIKNTMAVLKKLRSIAHAWN